MKKSLILVIVILNLFTQTVSSKEIRSMFGFYLDLPKDYKPLQNLNLNELFKNNPAAKFNKEFVDEMMVGTAKGDMDIEYFFPTKKYNPEFNNLYITNAKSNIKEFMTFEFKVLCDGMRDLFASLWNRSTIKQYKCIKNPKEITLKSPIIIKLVHEGPFNKTKLFNYYLEMNSGFITTVSLMCEIKNCRVLEKDLIKMTNSLKN
tara:strand:- start:71 stop:682 length:612 start_codon:yes stop_codon:yes gene_type:complete